MRQDTAQGAAELLDIGTGGVSAAVAVGECHHAIHGGRQGFARIAFGHAPGGVGGAIAGRHHGDVVARAHAAVFAHVAEKRGRVAALRQG